MCAIHQFDSNQNCYHYLCGHDVWNVTWLILDDPVPVGKWIEIKDCRLTYSCLTLYPMGMKAKVIINKGIVAIVSDNDDSDDLILKSIIGPYVESLNNIIDYNKAMAEYKNKQFEKRLFNSVNCLYNFGQKQNACSILCKILEHALFRNPRTGKCAYVFNVVAEVKKCSIIDWRCTKDTDLKRYIPKITGGDKPMIFVNVEFDNLKKRYFKIKNQSLLLYNFCEIFEHFLKTGRFNEEEIRDMHYIWPTELSLQNENFYNSLTFKTFKTMSGAMDYLNTSKIKGSIARLVLKSDVIMARLNTVCEFKYWCESCNIVGTGLSRNCCQSLEKITPWLDATMQLEWAYPQNSTEKINYPYRNNQSEKVRFTRGVLKEIYDYCKKENINAECLTPVCDFLYRTFYQKRPYFINEEAAYFVPLIDVFWDIITKKSAKLYFHIYIKTSRGGTNYTVIELVNFEVGDKNIGTKKVEGVKINHKRKRVENTDSLPPNKKYKIKN